MKRITKRKKQKRKTKDKEDKEERTWMNTKEEE